MVDLSFSLHVNLIKNLKKFKNNSNINYILTMSRNCIISAILTRCISEFTRRLFKCCDVFKWRSRFEFTLIQSPFGFLLLLIYKKKYNNLHVYICVKKTSWSSPMDMSNVKGIAKLLSITGDSFQTSFKR